MARPTITIHRDEVAEMLWQMRQEWCRGMRTIATHEPDPEVRSRLLLLADLFEAGVKVEGA